MVRLREMRRNVYYENFLRADIDRREQVNIVHRKSQLMEFHFMDFRWF